MTAEVQKRVSAVEFANTSRIHVAINVSNVERSLLFYQTLFGQKPSKLRADYAKFEVAEPPVNFTLNQHSALKPGEGALSHFGIQVKSTADVLAAKERFVQSGLTAFSEDEVTCCYAVQDKVWVTDPDGNNWEVFVVLEADSPVHSLGKPLGGADACCSPEAVQVTPRGKLLPLVPKS